MKQRKIVNNNHPEMEVDKEMLEDMKLDLCDIDINLDNVVACFSLGLRSGLTMDPVMLVMRGRNMELKGGKTRNVRIHLRRPACSATIYPTGKVTVIGNKSEDDAKTAARRIARSLQKILSKYPGICKQKLVKVKAVKVSMVNFRVTNVWASSQLPWDVRLPMFATNNRECSYEPELSPAITYQLSTPQACVRIFASGSLVIQAPKIVNIEKAISKIYPLAYPCRKERKKVKAKVKPTKSKSKDDDKLWKCSSYGGKKQSVKRKKKN